jgi:hypothetical protein
MHSAGIAPSSNPNSTAYTAIAGTQASASPRWPDAPESRWLALSITPIQSVASGANIRNASTTVRYASPNAVHLRASRSTFCHHAVIHQDASPAAMPAAGATLSDARAFWCQDANPAPLSVPMAM